MGAARNQRASQMRQTRARDWASDDVRLVLLLNDDEI